MSRKEEKKKNSKLAKYVMQVLEWLINEDKNRNKNENKNEVNKEKEQKNRRK